MTNQDTTTSTASEPATTQRYLLLGTAGHIDHGKTSLIKALTGVDTDRLPEEKQRGMTIELGFAHLEVGDGAEVVRFGIVDVPGHEKFVRTMVAGATAIDLVLLVVAALGFIVRQSTRSWMEARQQDAKDIPRLSADLVAELESIGFIRSLRIEEDGSIRFGHPPTMTSDDLILLLRRIMQRFDLVMTAAVNYEERGDLYVELSTHEPVVVGRYVFAPITSEAALAEGVVGRIGIIIDDFGYIRNRLTASFMDLQEKITFAIIPGHRFSQILADEADQSGHEVIIVGPGRRKNGDLGQENQIMIALRRYLPGLLYEVLEFCYSLLVYHRLRSAYRKHEPDVLYERGNLFAPAGVWLKRRYGIPMLLEVNAPIFQERSRFDRIVLRRLARWSEETTWREADYVLPVSYVLAKIIREAGVPDERIEVIPNAIDPNRFMRKIDNRVVKRRLGLEDKIVLGFTGFVRDWHDLGTVFGLLAENVNLDNLHLLIIGDGPARPGLEQEARNLGIANRLTFTGPVQRDQVPEYVAAFDIALQPGVPPYASPLKLFEYMALGRAIVAPNKPNIREILVDGETAVLFDPDNPISFPSAIARLISDPYLREEIGSAARKIIIERDLTWEHNARRIEAIAERLIGPGKSRSIAGA
ncbi:MAG: divergent polysaccharide deacetylase family protein [Planctomycetes bacterium]|nr:divergent polysaccharide deacetylase family protein [Planctomycetota bacterium]